MALPFQNEYQPIAKDENTLSTYWPNLTGDDLGAAIIDYAKTFRQWQNTNGLLKGYRLKHSYFQNEYRKNPEYPHLTVMDSGGAEGEYQYVSFNILRGTLVTIKSTIIQNPPSFQPKATNADADNQEGAIIYNTVLDYYTRILAVTPKIAKVVETGLVEDQGFMLIEWDAFSSDGDTPPEGIWSGSPSMKPLGSWDVFYDVFKSTWDDLDFVVVRDWVPREKVLAQFPEFADEINGSKSRADVLTNDMMYEGMTRYTTSGYSKLSNDIQVFKFFHKSQPWMEGGKFCMCLDDGKMLMENPLIYPKLPVERFVCAEQTDILLGYSPIGDLISIQEALNTLGSAITTNANNYANQYIVCEANSGISAKTFADGQKVIEYPPNGKPPSGLNLTQIPDSLFNFFERLEQFQSSIPGVSNASRGQIAGANQTGSAMLFSASQTGQNQGNMSQNYSDFCAAVATSLLHVIRVFARTQKTVEIAGKTVPSADIILADSLKDFDEFTVESVNPIANSPQGRIGLAQQLLQYGNITPQQFLQVVQTGNIEAASDPTTNANYELDKENEWLLDGRQVIVIPLDDHAAHIAKHKALFTLPWLRMADEAARIGKQNAPQIQKGIMEHIQEHMQMLAQNQTNSVATNAGAQPGQPETAPQPALGHMPQAPSGNRPQPPPNAPQGVNMPAPPNTPEMPK